jgi:hypothetical protein
VETAETANGWHRYAPYLASFLLLAVLVSDFGLIASLASAPLFVYAVLRLPRGRRRTATLVQSAIAASLPLVLIIVFA